MRENGILLNEKNAEKIDALCESVQGRATVRCINYNIISDTARRVIAHYTCKICLSKKKPLTVALLCRPVCRQAAE